jgi:uncharacterized protein (DUF302 family)
MHAHGHHVVLDADFDRVVVDILKAFQDEGLEILSRVDLREHFKRTLGREFRRHLVFDVWAPDLAINAVRQDLEIGTFIMTRFVIYELADGETVVTATEGLSRLLEACSIEHPGLAALADRERARAAEVLSRLTGNRRAQWPSAA